MTCTLQQARQRMQDAVAAAAAAPDAEAAGQRLAPLFDQIDWLRTLATQLMAPMRTDRLAAPILPAVRNGPTLVVTLAACAPVTLVLTLVDGRAERADMALPARTSISFSGMHSCYRLLSSEPLPCLLGEADGDLCRTRPMLLMPGEPLALDERRYALHYEPQERPILLLHARIDRIPAAPMRHHALGDGRLLSTVQADEGFARSVMLSSLLRAAGARDAAPTLIALLDRPNGRERWTVMRELVALDPAQAWPHLARMAAQDVDDGVRQAAAAVLAHHGQTQAAA